MKPIELKFRELRELSQVFRQQMILNFLILMALIRIKKMGYMINVMGHN
mgnify:CR=1 FL=1